MNVLTLNAMFVILLMLFARVWDAINDPMMGMIVDRHTTKMGRMRAYPVFTAIPIAILTILMFVNPGFDTQNKTVGLYVFVPKGFDAVNVIRNRTFRMAITKIYPKHFKKLFVGAELVGKREFIRCPRNSIYRGRFNRLHTFKDLAEIINDFGKKVHFLGFATLTV